MVMIRQQHCRVCEEATQHNNNTCVNCTERKSRAAMAGWIAKTTDEKLLDLHKRMLSREQGEPRF